MKVRNIKKAVKTFSDKEILTKYKSLSEISKEDLLSKLKTNINGLTDNDANNKLNEYGYWI